MKTKTTLVVTFQVPGLHYWPGAPQEHHYLSHPHRHVFHFKVFITTDNDREVEFISFKQHCETYVRKHLLLPNMVTAASCELIAETLFQSLSKMLFNVIRVECWEDGENGAIVEVEK